MLCAFSFTLSKSGNFLVTVEVLSTPKPWLTIGAFPDENEVIERCVRVLASRDDQERLLSHIILAAADRVPGSKWTQVELSEAELRAFGIVDPFLTHDGNQLH